MGSASAIERDGFEIRHGLFSQAELTLLEEVSADLEGTGSGKGGARNLFSSHPILLPIFKSEATLQLASRILGERIGVSECLYLNKNAEANWLVAWHQDLFVTVKSQVQAEGYSGWTLKGGKPYVLPPTPVLERSLWVRLNLDDNDPESGCLKVVPGSHRLGRIKPDEIDPVVAKHGERSLPCNKGDVILFHPLLLHASSKCSRPSQRRVFQVLYSGFRFHNGLEWPY